jgi:hypothetical protein
MDTGGDEVGMGFRGDFFLAPLRLYAFTFKFFAQRAKKLF